MYISPEDVTKLAKYFAIEMKEVDIAKWVASETQHGFYSEVLLSKLSYLSDKSINNYKHTIESFREYSEIGETDDINLFYFMSFYE